MDFRTLLERFGTEAMRSVFSEDVWTKLVVDKIIEEEVETAIISDWRFMNELNYIKEHLTDYKIVTINLLKKETLNSNHLSNQNLNVDFDEIIYNYGSLEDLEMEALKLTLTEDVLDNYFFIESTVSKEDYEIQYGSYWIEEIAKVFSDTKGYKQWLQELTN
jgi:hypothetical protein